MGRRLHPWLPGDVGVMKPSGVSFVVVSFVPDGQIVLVATAGGQLITTYLGSTWLNASRRCLDARDVIRQRTGRKRACVN